MRKWPLLLLALSLVGGIGAGFAETPASGRSEQSRPPGEAASRVVSGVRVLAAGDIACEPGKRATAGTCRQGATARLVRALNPTAVLALGDLQYKIGGWAEFMGSYDKTWGTFKAKTKPLPGNHEYLTRGASGYYTYFGRKAPGYYATDIGTWRVYLLNSNCDDIDCDREETWLRNDLAANPHRCSAIAMHRPRYSSGLEAGSSPSMARFWDIAYAHDVDLALAGHDHDYERFAPMDGHDHLRSDGIVSFVVGTGGRSLGPRGTTAPGSRYFRADRFGVLVLSLGAGAFSWDFRAIGGQVGDAGSRTCR